MPNKYSRMFRFLLSSVIFLTLRAVPASAGQTRNASRLSTTPTQTSTIIPNSPALVLNPHAGYIMSAEFSPDGKYVVASTFQGEVVLWNAQTGEEVRRFVGHKGDVRHVTFTSDSRFIVSGCVGSISGDDNSVRIWFVESGAEVKRISANNEMFAISIGVSPDGKYVLTGGYSDKVSTAILWEFSTAKQVKVFRGHQRSIEAVAFSPSGEYILTGGGSESNEPAQDNTARLWDIQTGREIRSFLGHTSEIQSVSFSPDGKSVLTAGSDKKVILWDISTGNPKQEFVGHADRVNSAKFSPDGRYILTGSWDKTVRLWDVATGKESQQISTDWINVVDFSPDGKKLLTGGGDGVVRIWGLNGS